MASVVAQRTDPAPKATRAGGLPFDPGKQESPRGNLLLARLPEAQFKRLRACLQPVWLVGGDKLAACGHDEAMAVFPVRAVLSLYTTHSDGTTVSFSSVGREGFLGFDLLSPSASRTPATVVLGGLAYLLPAQRLRDEFGRQDEFARQLLAHANTLVAQAAVLCACNRRHALEQQLARWLLVMLDRLPGNELVVTQEMIGSLLGVRREGVTEAARRLQDSGLIEYRRGHIFVLERAGLAERACECYGAIRAQFDQLFAT